MTGPNPYTVVLAWPVPALWPNHKAHWRDKRKASLPAKRAAMWEAKIAGWISLPDVSYDLHLTFHPPTRGRFDLDGALGAMKWQIDGLSDLIGVDDSRFGYVIRKGQPTSGGAVVVVVRPGANAVPVAFEPAPVAADREAGRAVE